jgi:hypothetical protein
MKISLCMIVGNVEDYILRCLESFATVADEICVVRAIGKQEADSTMDKVIEFCCEKRIPHKTANYFNRPEHKDWPHVDDFAAARQQSFDLAEGEYCFWADSDDVLEEQPGIKSETRDPKTEENPKAEIRAALTTAQIIRQCAERGGYAAFVFPYKIFGRGVSVPRERMIAKNAGRWRYPVHECFKFHIEPVQAVEDLRVQVVHMPHLNKSGSSERNLQILKSIPDQDLTPGMLYHLQGELAIAGDTLGAVQTAQRALKSPELGRPERYELFLNLAQLATAPGAKESMLVHAYMADPRRREALALLACHSMDSCKPDVALAYARQMMATVQPKNPDWNDRAAAYGWLGEEVYSQALRLSGLAAEAEFVRKHMLTNAGGARIALIHATRGRPQQAALCRKLWLDLAERPDAVEHIFVMDADDEESIPLRRMHHLVVPGGGGCVAAWNDGCAVTTAPIVVQLSDDWIPCPMWDKLLIERMGDVTQPKVLAISDGVRADDLLCMGICTRAYVELDWFMFHPDFTGVYSDNWFTELAYRRGMVVEARDIAFVHRHPLANQKSENRDPKTEGNPKAENRSGNGAVWDETYARQNAPERYVQGKAVFERLQAGGDWSEIPGFYNYWQLYQHIATQLRDGDTIAELGVWLGRSIIHLAQMLKRQGKRVKILAVDHFHGELNQPAHAAVVKAAGGSLRGAFERNCRAAGVEDMITILDGDTAAMADQVADGSLAFCYVDAAHDYESVKRDLAAWEAKMRKHSIALDLPAGIMAGHDAQHEPVIRAVKERWAETMVMGPVWVRGKL